MSLIASTHRPRAAAPPQRLGPKPGEPSFAQALGEGLIEAGFVDAAGVARCRRAAEVAGERFDKVLVKLGLISEGDLATALAAFCDLPLVGPEQLPARAVFTDRLGYAFLHASQLLPVSIEAGRLLCAVTDPFDREPADAVAYRLGMAVDLAIIAPADLEEAFRTLYGEDQAGRQPEADPLAGFAGAGASDLDIERLRELANEAPIIRLVNQIITRAVERRASDIHVEPERDHIVIRYRIDGLLRHDQAVPAALRAALTTRMKIMAQLDIGERRLPQDGRIKTTVRGVEIDVRVSTLPTVFGESIVMRILDRTHVELDFDKIGLSARVIQGLHRLMRLPNGIVLVTGPTGSGKTTTLYTALNHLNRPDLKLFTVEDPIEYQLAGISQIQVQPQIGLGFPLALRSILRQDPDIVLIGEIRDLETARIAIQAALTGHLVFSTLHTNSAVAAVPRLVDIGIEPYLLASTVAGIMAQRLVRRLCSSCARPHSDPHAVLSRIRCEAADTLNPSRLREPVGCDACGGSGYSGRTAIAELLVIDETLRDTIARAHDARALATAAKAGGLGTLYEDGVAKVAAGETTLDEVLRVTREI